MNTLIADEIREILIPFGPKSLACNFLSKNIKNYAERIIILPIVLHGCKTCSLALRADGGR